MGENHIGGLKAGILPTNNPPLTNDVDFFPGQPARWGLGYMLTPESGPTGPAPAASPGPVSSTPITARPEARGGGHHDPDPALRRS